MKSNNIPSEEDFKRAEAAEAERNRGLSDVRARILHRFKKNKVHEVFVFYSPKTKAFKAYVFFRMNKQIEESEKTGLINLIKQAVIEELENVGRGSRNTYKVDFEFDSHENVVANFEGDYYLRLR